MIATEREYRLTLRKLKEFEDALAAVDGYRPETPLLQSTMKAALEEQIATLKQEAQDFEELRSGRIRSFAASTLPELAERVIAARTAAGLTQAQLAAAIGSRAQQVQRDEANRYAGASIDRLQRVIDALGLEMTAHVTLGHGVAALGEAAVPQAAHQAERQQRVS